MIVILLFIMSSFFLLILLVSVPLGRNVLSNCTLMECALMKCALTSVTCEKNNKVCQLILFSMNETSKKRIFQSLLRPIPHPTPLISTCIDEKILCRNRNYTLQYNMSWVPQKSVVSDKNFNLHILSMELMFHNSPFNNH